MSDRVRRLLFRCLNSPRGVVHVRSRREAEAVKAEAVKSDAFRVERDGTGDWLVRYVDDRLREGPAPGGTP